MIIEDPAPHPLSKHGAAYKKHWSQPEHSVNRFMGYLVPYTHDEEIRHFEIADRPLTVLPI
jgi:hypothetical protein